MPLPPFRPAWWIPGPHAQTLWGKLARRVTPVPTRRERWETPDGDFLDLHRLPAPRSAPANAPRVLLLHGLEGTIRSHYAQGMLAHMHALGWAADLLIFRSCGEELNRTRRFYHSGETSDLAFVLDRLTREAPDTPLAIAGVSLGGNVLLKYLGERGGNIPGQLFAAAAVSVPFDLARGSKHLQAGFARVYERHFLRTLKRKVQHKMHTFPDLAAPGQVNAITTLYDFDDQLTAPIHGFTDAADYYGRSSAIKYLDGIKINTLLLSAHDDPFLPRPVLAEVDTIARCNSHLHVEFTPHGGHAGFIARRGLFEPLYYLEHRVGEFLATQYASLP